MPKTPYLYPCSKVEKLIHISRSRSGAVLKSKRFISGSYPSTHEISWKSIHNFFSNLVHRQTNKVKTLHPSTEVTNKQNKTRNKKQWLLRVTAIPVGPTTHYSVPRQKTSLAIHVVQKITIIRAQKIGKSAVWNLILRRGAIWRRTEKFEHGCTTTYHPL